MKMTTASKWNNRLRRMSEIIPISIYQTVYQRDFFIFFYHVISDQPLLHVKHLYAYKSAQMFENDLIYLLKNNFVATYEQLANHLQGRTSLRPNSVILSFDDGFSECFSVVRPLLLKYEVPCTFFITTDLIDNQKMDNSTKVSLIIEKIVTSDPAWKQDAFRVLFDISGVPISDEMEFINWIKRIQFTDGELINQLCDVLEIDIAKYLRIQKPFMTKKEIRTLASDGFTIGAHSKSHSLFYKLSEKDIEMEIVESCRIIHGITHEECVPFAFPFSGNGVNRKILNDIRSRNRYVGFYFDTNGIRQHKGEVLDRIWADVSVDGDIDKSNLPELINKSYQEMFLDGFRRYKQLFSSRYPSKN